MSDLIDTDGENRAVRGFLLGREAGIRAFAAMRQHMTHYGTPYWPATFTEKQGHITKAEQQEWLRHLFALEAQPVPITSESGNQAAQGASAITSESAPLLSRGEVDACFDGLMPSGNGKSRYDIARQIEQAVRSKLGAGLGWQPIETAPKEEAILGYWPDGFYERVVMSDDGEDEIYHILHDGEQRANNPTHWMQLPPPPGIVGKEGA